MNITTGTFAHNCYKLKLESEIRNRTHTQVFWQIAIFCGIDFTCSSYFFAGAPFPLVRAIINGNGKFLAINERQYENPAEMIMCCKRNTPDIN